MSTKPLSETSFEVASDLQRAVVQDVVHPVLLTWQDICYTLDGDNKQILQQISGYAEPGTLTAVIGASGSGKTSLLSILAGRLLETKLARLTGKLLVNEEPAPGNYRLQCGFVEQVEVFYPFSTVRETVEMSACLRLGTLPKAEKKSRAMEVIQQLGLTKVINTNVGDGVMVKGISGGEMKRVAIACELVASPSLVFLDEPTSGLDSNVALNVVKILKELAIGGRTVMMSVHQPGSPLYALFDNLVLLAEGSLAYFGPVSKAIDHFQNIGYPCPPLFNPADFMLQITSLDFSSSKAESDSRVVLAKILGKAGETLMPAPRPRGSKAGPAMDNKTACCEQFMLLFSRILRDVLRNKIALAIKFVEGVMAMLIFMALYGKMREGNVVYVNQSNVIALLYLNCISCLFGPMYATIMVFSPEVKIVLRERMNNLYGVGPYYISKLLVSVLHELGPLLVRNTLGYWGLQFDHSLSRYLVFLLFTCSMTLASMSVGFLLAVAFGGNAQAGITCVGPIFLLLYLFGGFYINIETIPPWLSWFSDIAYVRFTYEGLAINELNGGAVTAKGVQTRSDGTCPNVDITKCEEGASILARLFNNGVQKTQAEWSEQMWLYLVFVLLTIAVFNVFGYLLFLAKGPKYMKMTMARAA